MELRLHERIHLFMLGAGDWLRIRDNEAPALFGRLVAIAGVGDVLSTLQHVLDAAPGDLS